MAAKHTPGPWLLVYANLDHDPEPEVLATAVMATFKNGGGTICALYENMGSHLQPYENAAYNAALIAAAPEMLEQLIVCRSVLRTALSDITDPTGIRVIERRIHETSAVIAKARGETP